MPDKHRNEFIRGSVQRLGTLRVEMLHVQPPDGDQFVIMDVPRSRAWLELHHADWTVTRIESYASPKAVHAAFRSIRKKGRTRLGCHHGEARRLRYGQTIEDAFMIVEQESITCPTCRREHKAVMAGPNPDSFIGPVALLPWDWENVPESYRPGNPNHHN